MSDRDFSKVRHDINNKIATMDASLSALRIYVKRLAAPADSCVSDKKALIQSQEISEDMLKVTKQLKELIAELC